MRFFTHNLTHVKLDIQNFNILGDACITSLSGLNKLAKIRATNVADLDIVSNTLADHDCVAQLEQTRRHRQSLVDFLESSTNYQLRPTYHQPVQLIEECNHTTCDCGESFCYACGEGATVASGHWHSKNGSCPLYQVHREN